jgi:PTS system mannose-specific IIA component
VVGIVVVGHSQVPTALLAAAEMILGPQPDVRALNLVHDTNLEQFEAEMRSFTRHVDTGDGVLILCDLFGGSPSNTAASLVAEGAEVVAGVNLPMLLEVLGRRDLLVDELAALARASGQAGVVHVNRMLNEG